MGAEKFTSDGDFKKALVALPVIKANHGLLLNALVDHTDNGVKRKAGDMWQLEGPLTYYPSADAVCVLSIGLFYV